MAGCFRSRAVTQRRSSPASADIQNEASRSRGPRSRSWSPGRDDHPRAAARTSGAGTTVTIVPSRRNIPMRSGFPDKGRTIGSAASDPKAVSPSCRGQTPTIDSTSLRSAAATRARRDGRPRTSPARPAVDSAMTRDRIRPRARRREGDPSGARSSRPTTPAGVRPARPLAHSLSPVRPHRRVRRCSSTAE